MPSANRQERNVLLFYIEFDLMCYRYNIYGLHVFLFCLLAVALVRCLWTACVIMLENVSSVWAAVLTRKHLKKTSLFGRD